MVKDKHIARRRLSRTFAVGACGLVGVLATVLASPVLMPRIIRHHPEWLRRGSFKRYAEFRRKHAGHRHSATALLTHVGRRTGKPYRTPVGAQPYGDGFVVSLPYGSQTDWCRNVAAAARCELTWKGRKYQLVRPEIIAGSRVFPTLPVLPRIVLHGAGIHEFLWLHKSTANEDATVDGK